MIYIAAAIIGFVVLLGLTDTLLMLACSLRCRREEMHGRCILVLGSKLKEGRLTRSLKARLDKAAALMRKHEDTFAIVCGGAVHDGVCEADVMLSCLVAAGIAKSRVLKEDKSLNTVENFKYAKEKLKSGDMTVTVVTSGCHMFRSLLIAKKYGFIARGVAAKTPPRYLFKSFVRESCSIVRYYLIELGIIKA